ncbi:MAG: hypothetical protein HQM00_00615 [Magnetococcales bacterium]|nr:hypothetical protein [Magnetococcales bacterium]
MDQPSDETTPDRRAAHPDATAATRSESGHGQPMQQRRRLLKGLVSAGAGIPVILTLSSGSALAATSTTCLENQTEVEDDINNTERCTANGSTETQVRADRVGTFFNDTIDAMSGGTGADNDRCLVYHYPHGHVSQGVAVVGTTPNWGKDGTNVRINLTCWNSLVNS